MVASSLPLKTHSRYLGSLRFFSSFGSIRDRIPASVAETKRDSGGLRGLRDRFSKLGLKNKGSSLVKDEQRLAFGGVEVLGESEKSDNKEEEEKVDLKADNSSNDNFEDEMRDPLVRETCRLINLRPVWDPKLEEQLIGILRSLGPRKVCAVLHSLKDSRVALMFFDWADWHGQYHGYPIVYNAMLEILGKTKLSHDALRIFKLMKRRGISLSQQAFSHLMTSYSRAGKIKSALEVLTMMKKEGFEPNLSVCNIAVHSLVMAYRLNQAFDFMEQMEVSGVKPDVMTYNCLIKGYCMDRRIVDALKLIDDMPGMGYSPDKISYRTVMSFLCKSKRVNEIRALIEKMEERGLTPDQTTYNFLIHRLSNYGHGNEALEFLREGEKKGFKFDKVEYSAMVDCFCKNKNIDMAKEMVNEMFERKCVPDVVTYTSVLHGFCLEGKVDEAKEMIKQMRKHGCKPNVYTYTALLTGLCRNGNSSEAREIMKTCDENWWVPDAVTYNAVLHGLLREKKFDQACELAKEMAKKGFFLSPVIINSMIESFLQEGDTNNAKKFMEWCINNGCAVNVINFNTVIQGFCCKDDLETAMSLLDDMYLCDKCPDAFTYTVIADAFGRNGKINEADKLIRTMLGKKIDPTPVMYAKMIHWFCVSNRVKDLFEVLDEMRARLDLATLDNQVIEKLCSLGNLEEAENHLHKVLKSGSNDNRITCNTLIEYYLNQGLFLLANRVAHKMFEQRMIPGIKLCKSVSKELFLDGYSKKADILMKCFLKRAVIFPKNLVPEFKRGLLL